MPTTRRAFLVGVATLADPFGGSYHIIRAVTAQATTMEEARQLHGALAAGQVCAFLGALLLLTLGVWVVLSVGGALGTVGGVAVCLAPLVVIHGLWHYWMRR